MVKGTFSKIALVVLLSLGTSWTYGQIINSGEITFIRRTNLEKRFEGSALPGRMNNNLKEPKEDRFKLYFNETSSLFIPVPVTVGEEDREWATTKTTTLLDLNSGEVNREFSFMGSNVYLNEKVTERDWIITGTSRDIAGYHSKQAMWVVNDSTTIYAWFSEQIAPSVGPETYWGLPGTILGLAIEDGGVVYFAEEVKPLAARDRDFKSKMPKGRERTTFTKEGLYDFMIERFSTGGFTSNRMLNDILIW